MKKYGVLSFSKCKLYSGTDTGESEDKIEPFNQNASIVFFVYAVIIDFFLIWSVYLHTDTIINAAKLIVILLVLQLTALIDIKKRIIPNLILMVSLGIRLVLYIFEFVFYRENFFSMIKSDLIGFAFGFGVLLLVSIISKQSLGFGDVKLFGVIGITLGLTCTFMTLLTALVFSALYGVAMIIAKKKSKKSSMPFAPFIYFGYVVCLILTVY